VQHPPQDVKGRKTRSTSCGKYKRNEAKKKALKR